MNEQLESFLKEQSDAPAAVPSAESNPTPEVAPDTKADAPAQEVSPDTPESNDDVKVEARPNDSRTVPLAALEGERKARQDWKEKASRAEGELAELRRQLEEAKRPPTPVPQQQQAPAPQMLPLPDPNVDPVGYVTAFAARQQVAMFNERLNNSEMMMREKMPAAELDAYVADFKRELERDPSLVGKLQTQIHPYGWLVKEVDRLRLLRDVGDDPTAFRARIEAEARAKWEAEAAARGPAVPQAAPLPNMAPSLATARSVAGRTAPAWTGEASEEDVVDQIRARKRR
jgi:hypothetical protein